MEKPIKITKDWALDLPDLMKEVDADAEFTLRDVFGVIKNSIQKTIGCTEMEEILNCSDLCGFIDDLEKQPFEDGKNLDYLELSWRGSVEFFQGKKYFESSWDFDGVGKAGEIPEDVVRNSTKEEVDKMKAEGWRQKYAIEFTPLHKLADYKIKISDVMTFEDYAQYDKGDCEGGLKKINFRPSITVIELLYWIVWELSFFGNVEGREQQKEELGRRIENFEKAKKEGRLDEICVPWEKIKEKFDLEKENKNGM